MPTSRSSSACWPNLHSAEPSCCPWAMLWGGDSFAARDGCCGCMRYASYNDLLNVKLPYKICYQCMVKSVCSSSVGVWFVIIGDCMEAAGYFACKPFHRQGIVLMQC